VVRFENELFACAQLSVHVLSGARQISFARERLDKFGHRVLMRVNSGISILVDSRGLARARWLVESRPHHQMRGSGDPRTGGNRETGGLYKLQVGFGTGNPRVGISTPHRTRRNRTRGGYGCILTRNFYGIPRKPAVYHLPAVVLILKMYYFNSNIYIINC